LSHRVTTIVFINKINPTNVEDTDRVGIENQ
jgi:hypothetical protein